MVRRLDTPEFRNGFEVRGFACVEHPARAKLMSMNSQVRGECVVCGDQKHETECGTVCGRV